jgi:hypothetical protein
MATGFKTGGRKKGTRNKRTVERQETIARVEETIPDAFQGDAHALLVAIYKDPAVDARSRLDAAKAALPYEKARLATIAHTGKDGGPVEQAISVRLDAAIARLAAEEAPPKGKAAK